MENQKQNGMPEFQKTPQQRWLEKELRILHAGHDELMRDRKAALKLLQEIGIYDEHGNLTKAYGGK